MHREKTPEEIYDELVNQGFYEEANLDKDVIEKEYNMIIENYEYAKRLTKGDDPNGRVLFNIHYDVIRELCSLLMLFEKQKISNHQGLFAFIILNFKELDFDWNFLEKIRTKRNRNKYQREDITKEFWDSIKLQLNLYINSVKKDLINKIENLK